MVSHIYIEQFSLTSIICLFLLQIIFSRSAFIVYKDIPGFSKSYLAKSEIDSKIPL